MYDKLQLNTFQMPLYPRSSNSSFKSWNLSTSYHYEIQKQNQKDPIFIQYQNKLEYKNITVRSSIWTKSE